MRKREKERERVARTRGTAEIDLRHEESGRYIPPSPLFPRLFVLPTHTHTLAHTHSRTAATQRVTIQYESSRAAVRRRQSRAPTFQLAHTHTTVYQNR